MSSNRLPGKMLMDINGRPLLGRVLDRVKFSKSVSKLIVATSNKLEDDKIEEFCKQEEISCFRGDLINVYNRFKEILINQNPESFIRINGDSPFIDSKLIDLAAEKFNHKYDLVTNIFPRSYPKGQSVEIVSSKSFLSIDEKKLTREQKEHVTKYFYDNSNHFSIKNFQSKIDYSNLNFCVDTKNDLKKIVELSFKSKNKNLSWEELSTKNYNN